MFHLPVYFGFLVGPTGILAVLLQDMAEGYESQNEFLMIFMIVMVTVATNIVDVDDIGNDSEYDDNDENAGNCREDS